MLACWISDHWTESSGGKLPGRDACDRAVKLPVTRRRENEVARLFRLDSETVSGSAGEMRERTRRRAPSRPITDKERQLALHNT